MNENQQENRLTDLHKEVYRIVSEHPGITQEELCSIAVGDGFDLHYAEKAAHGDHCRKLWDIVQELNFSDEVDGVIVADSYTYRIGTAEEVFAYGDWLLKKVCKTAKRYRVVMGKYLKDGQVKLDLDGSAGERITEAFRAA